MCSAQQGIIDFSQFSVERHKLIVKYKTAYYSFHLPIALAMLLCDIPETYIISTRRSTQKVRPYELALSILLPIGELFQVQDDFFDFATPPEVLGKIGTDIVDNKCSWCINTALQLCTPEQRHVLERNYGRKGDLEAEVHRADSEGSEAEKVDTGAQVGGLCEKRVNEVYEAAGLCQVYANYEDSVYRRLIDLIDAIPEDGVILDENGRRAKHKGIKRLVFRSCLEKIYHMEK